MPLGPDSWRLRDVPTVVRVGDDLQRMAVGMPKRMASMPFNLPGGADNAPVGQTQADANNGRIPPELAEALLRAARLALENSGLGDAGPE